MNAAVSLTMCAFGRLAWKMLPLYVFAQFLGSFLAAGTIYAVYYGESGPQIEDAEHLGCSEIIYFSLPGYCCSISAYQESI